jgi:RAQPRD family integrative conjugative element protein
MIMQRKKMILRVMFGLFLGFPASLLAQPSVAMETDIENVSLARIYTVLNHLTPLIDEAKRYQNKQARVQFRYDQLQQDIDQIKHGIDQKFHPQRIEPRSISPIQGDYLRFKHKTK